MTTTSPSSSAVVIDSNLAVWEVVPVLAQLNVSECFASWAQSAVRLYAPTLWAAESVSAVRSAVYARLITIEEAEAAIDDLFALEVELVGIQVTHCRSALEWAARLNQRRAYDAFYLALAEQLGVEFWTADQRLVSSSHQAGATWVHWIGEMSTGP